LPHSSTLCQMCVGNSLTTIEKLDGPTVSVLQHVIAEIKQRWSVIAMSDQKFIISSYRLPVAFAVVPLTRTRAAWWVIAHSPYV
jgi:hypothetical protein